MHKSVHSSDFREVNWDIFREAFDHGCDISKAVIQELLNGFDAGKEGSLVVADTPIQSEICQIGCTAFNRRHCGAQIS